MRVTRHYVISGPGVRFALVSDLQDKEYGNLIEQIRSESPDAILLTGNIITRMDPDASEWNWEKMDKWLTRIYGKSPYERLIDSVGNMLHAKYSGQNAETRSHGMQFLREVSSIAPTFYSVGNLEWYFTESDKALFSEHGITLLDNADVEVEIKGKKILLGGLSTRYDFDWLVDYSHKKGFKVLLCHHPEQYRQLVEETMIDSFDLIVGGHYHGGQWRIGNRGVYVPRIGMMQKDVAGQFGRLIISAGVVNTSRLPRFGNPCELVIIDAKETKK